jgi:hypothetical protein
MGSEDFLDQEDLRNLGEYLDQNKSMNLDRKEFHNLFHHR